MKTDGDLGIDDTISHIGLLAPMAVAVSHFARMIAAGKLKLPPPPEPVALLIDSHQDCPCPIP